MKSILVIIGVLFMTVLALATPSAIGLAIYQWAFSDVDIALALWAGFKTWLSMTFLGAVVGYPCYMIGISK